MAYSQNAAAAASTLHRLVRLCAPGFLLALNVNCAHAPKDSPPLPEHICRDLEDRWDFADLDGTEEVFVRLSHEARRVGDQECLLEVLTQIARIRGLRRQHESAMSILADVERRLSPGMHLARTRVALERGRVLNGMQQLAKAEERFRQALEDGKQSQDPYLEVDAAHMLAIVHSSQPQIALEWNHKALAIAETSNNPRGRKWLGSLYNNLGWTYFDQRDYATALALLEKALRWREDNPKPNNPRPVLLARWGVGRVLRAMGQVREALAIQRALECEYEAKGLAASGYLYEEIGECLLLLGDGAATNYFKRAYELLDEEHELDGDQERERKDRLKRLATGARS